VVLLQLVERVPRAIRGSCGFRPIPSGLISVNIPIRVASPGSFLFSAHRRPDCRHHVAANERYGLHVGSGQSELKPFCLRTGGIHRNPATEADLFPSAKSPCLTGAQSRTAGPSIGFFVGAEIARIRAGVLEPLRHDGVHRHFRLSPAIAWSAPQTRACPPFPERHLRVACAALPLSSKIVSRSAMSHCFAVPAGDVP